jgi:hypothetical protein
MQLFPMGAIANFTSSFVATLHDNLAGIIVLFAIIVGLSIVMAIYDTVTESRDLHNRWHR